MAPFIVPKTAPQPLIPDVEKSEALIRASQGALVAKRFAVVRLFLSEKSASSTCETVISN